MHLPSMRSRAASIMPLRFPPARGLSAKFSSPLTRQTWICPTCCHGRITRRAASSSSKDSAKPFYVTTPIFYVNACHMYSMMLADSIKRWQTLRQRKALLCTGTDEHGMKLQQAAAEQGVPPKEFCDGNAEKFRELARVCGLDNDFFVRTTDPDHIAAVQHFWYMLREKGYIYETTHSGWYCVSDECFYQEKEIERTVVPLTGRTIMASIVSGKEVEWTEERNYHFRMTALKDELLKFYEENPDWILPKTRMTEVVSWVKNNLEDLSISRPKSRLSWGIPVPDDPSQTIYVWVDALINYATKAGFPNWAPGEQQKGGWPADVHVIGKDILRFHGVYWPALLLAVGLPPPKQLLSHAHWTMDKKKMSKSTGNVVNPFFAIDRWGLDTMRYFMLRDGGIDHDADYDNAHIFARHDKDLQSTIGNLLSRITRSQKWKVSDAVAWARTHGADSAGSDHAYADRKKLARLIDETGPAMALAMETKLRPPNAIREAMKVLAQANKYIATAEPWNAVGDERSEIIYHAAEALRVAGILLQPFMPVKMGELLDVLGVRAERRTFDFAGLRKDFDYGTPEKPELLKKGKWAALFPPPPADG